LEEQKRLINDLQVQIINGYNWESSRLQTYYTNMQVRCGVVIINSSKRMLREWMQIMYQAWEQMEWEEHKYEGNVLEEVVT